MVEEQKFRQDLLYRINAIELKLPPLRERTEDLELLANHFVKKMSSKYHKPKLEISDKAIESLKTYHWPGNIRELEHIIERAVIITDNPEIESEDLHFSTKRFDTEVTVAQAIEKHAGNISKAAKDLGLTRAALYRRLEKHDL